MALAYADRMVILRHLVAGSIWSMLMAPTLALGVECEEPGTPTPYCKLKQLEQQFPPTNDYLVVKLATIDVRERTFTPVAFPPGYSPEIKRLQVEAPAPEAPADSSVPIAGYKPPIQPRPTPTPVQQRPPKIFADAFEVGLEFEFMNKSSDAIQMTMNGETKTLSPTENTVRFDIKSASRVEWNITVGSRAIFGDTNEVLHLPLVGHVGVFTIPVMPIGILYEPPQDQSKQNKASYLQSTLVGSAVTTAFAYEDTPKVTTNSAGFEDLDQFTSALKQISKLAGDIPGKSMKATKGIVDGLIGASNALFGTASGSETIAAGTSGEHSLEISDTSGAKGMTSLHLGPGEGDVVYYIRNMRFAYACSGMQMHARLMEKGSNGQASVHFLKDELASIKSGSSPKDLDGYPIGPKTLMRQQSIEGLLTMDPFVEGGPDAALGADRYDNVGKKDCKEINGSSEEKFWEHVVKTTDKQGTAETRTEVTNTTPGFLARLGLGVRKNVHTNTKMTNSSLKARITGSVERSTLELFAGADEYYSICGYYDRAYGTFAYKLEPIGMALVSGTVYDTNHDPVVGGMVTLVDASGSRFEVRTDKHGQYMFRSRSIKAGRGNVRVKGIPGTTTVLVEPSRGSRVDIAPQDR